MIEGLACLSRGRAADIGSGTHESQRQRYSVKCMRIFKGFSKVFADVCYSTDVKQVSIYTE